MEPPLVSLVLVLALGLTVTLPEPTMVHAEGSSVPDEDTTTNMNMTREGQNNQCSPLQRRQDLLDSRLNGVQSSLNGVQNSLNERDTRLTELDSRLNRIDTRLDGIETVMSDFKEYLRQRMDAIEVKAEWALTGTKHKGEKTEVGSRDYRPLRTSQVHKGCQEAYRLGWTSSGLYRIAPEPNTQVDVLCEQELDGGGWTVFQVRKDGSVNFYEDWNTYKAGFGDLTSEFWLGNDHIHLITKRHNQQLKIELTSPEGEVKYVDYSQFSIEDEAHKYRLNVTGFTGKSPPGNSFGYHNGHPFSTKDNDNDALSEASCATKYLGGWWYGSCHSSNLNGLYGSEEYGKGLNWQYWKGHRKSMKATRMMLRRKA